MTHRPYHNAESFARAIESLIRRADEEGRGEDLDRLIHHLDHHPAQVTELGAFMLMLDEDWRLLVRDEVEAFQRWGRQKARTISEDEIMVCMRRVYADVRKQRGKR